MTSGNATKRVSRHDGDERPEIAAMKPIEMNGNWLWKDGRRFLIKGITYHPRKPNLNPHSSESYIDPLSETWLPNLRLDIPYFQDLGINTVFVDHSDTTANPSQALQLLEEAGVHVLLTLLTDLRPKQRTAPSDKTEPADLQKLYSTELVANMLTIINQTASHANILGYALDFESLNHRATTHIASLHRAAVRDAKQFLSLRRSRQVPVGASLPASVQLWTPALEFMAAGDPAERIDFLGSNCYSWAAKSNFRISGYENMVKRFSPYPVPMFFSEFGAVVGEGGRRLDEVGSLFSPDMTGVFSGGFLEGWGCTRVRAEVGGDRGGGGDGDGDGDVGGYELMRVELDGVTRRPKVDFWTYKAKLEMVAARSEDEVLGGHERKDYESWQGEVPGLSNFWSADLADVPEFPLVWDDVLEKLRD